MKTKRRIVITSQQHETIIIRFQKNANRRLWCGQCAGEVETLTLDEAVLSTNLPAREIFNQSETGKIHAIETAEGFLLVCLDSVMSLADRNFSEIQLEVTGDTDESFNRKQSK